MPKTYEIASNEVRQIAEDLIAQHHPDLAKTAPKIDFLFAYNPGGDAVTLNGYPCAAVAKIIGLKERAAGRGDLEVVIDARLWKDLPEPKRRALLDHELHHFVSRLDKDGIRKRDDLGRPCFRMRKHDVQVGWFELIARRHGRDSMEVAQARLLWNSAGQAFFPFVHESLGVHSGELTESATGERVHPIERAIQGDAGERFRDVGGSVTISSGGKEILKIDSTTDYASKGAPKKPKGKRLHRRGVPVIDPEQADESKPEETGPGAESAATEEPAEAAAAH